MNEQDELLSDFEVKDEIVDYQNSETKEVEVVPSRIDTEWSNYLMSKLTEDELYYQKKPDGSKGTAYPKVNSLRRLTLAHLGLITNSGIKNFVPPSLCMQEGRLVQQYAVVVYEVVVRLHGSNDILTYSEIADAHPQFNLDKLVSGHASPMAATRAEARTLRKMLGLNVAAAEEIQRGGKDVAEMLNKTNNNDESSNQDNIQQDQINVINKMVNKLGIDLSKLINKRKLTEMTREEGQNICSDLAYWNKNKNVPVEFLKQ